MRYFAIFWVLSLESGILCSLGPATFQVLKAACGQWLPCWTVYYWTWPF